MTFQITSELHSPRADGVFHLKNEILNGSNEPSPSQI